MKVAHETKLLYQRMACLVARLARSVDLARVPTVLLAAAFLFAALDQSAQQLEKVIGLTGQLARALGGRGTLLDRLAQRGGRRVLLGRGQGAQIR
jgi:hypothetical protein